MSQNNTDEKRTEGKAEASSSGRSESPQARPDLSDSAQTVVWGGRLPSRRRAISGGLTGLAIVLVSNFGGSTSGLLSLDGGRLAGRLKLDALYPVAGHKRCLDTQNGYEFLYPSRWLSDQRLYRRYAERVERQASLDPPPAARRKGRSVAEPTAAYGPPGSTGEENLSVVVAPINGGFKLGDLGGPRQAAERFLSTTVAPEDSNRTAELINAYERRDESGQLYYTMEFTVRSPNFFRHNLSVYAARDGLLYTLNGQCQDVRWPDLQADMRVAAESFRVSAPKTSIPGWGTQP
ncbi:g3745 [Coccomyxa elongata]